jgi:hypothetical protein
VLFVVVLSATVLFAAVLSFELDVLFEPVLLSVLAVVLELLFVPLPEFVLATVSAGETSAVEASVPLQPVRASVATTDAVNNVVMSFLFMVLHHPS